LPGRLPVFYGTETVDETGVNRVKPLIGEGQRRQLELEEEEAEM
jgi:hypothetical protein